MSRLTRLAFVAALVLSGCASATATPASLDIGCADFEHARHIEGTASLSIGTQLVVTLCGNPSTGFAWEPAKVTGAAVRVVSQAFEEDATVNRVGSPGILRLILEGSQSGSATVELGYSQPWPGGTERAWSYALAVDVK